MMKPPLLLLFFFLIGAASFARADIIPKEMHAIYVQANITNLDEYPATVFIQLETLGQEIREKRIIGSEGKVKKGYKFNHLEILAVSKEDLGAAGGIDGLDLLAGPRIIRSKPDAIESGQQLVPRSSSLAGKDVFYRVSIENNALVFTKTGEKRYREAPNYVDVNLLPYAFAVTFIVELIVFMVLIRWVIPGPVPGKGRGALCVLGAQALTLPLLWLLINHYNLFGTPVYLCAELSAVLAETFVYRFFARLGWRSAFIVAVLCNGASYMMGMMV